jgi:hypothetical protein
MRFAPALFVLWASGYLAAKAVALHADPLTFLTVRYAGVVVLMTALALMVRAPWPRSGRELVHLASDGGVHVGDPPRRRSDRGEARHAGRSRCADRQRPARASTEACRGLNRGQVGRDRQRRASPVPSVRTPDRLHPYADAGRAAAGPRALGLR